LLLLLLLLLVLLPLLLLALFSCCGDVAPIDVAMGSADPWVCCGVNGGCCGVFDVG